MTSRTWTPAWVNVSTSTVERRRFACTVAQTRSAKPRLATSSTQVRTVSVRAAFSART
ncbi:MAG: hypothetical protein ABI269_00700 [Lapillicoccus sp.]